MKRTSSWWTVSLALAIVAGGIPLRAEEPKQAETSAATPHVTRSLRVKSPSVTVRANPSAPQINEQRTGQTAFLDENGELTSTPPADFAFPEPDAPRAQPVEWRSTVDPNAILIDTSHIRAVMRAQIGDDGKPVIECLHSSDPALQESCTHPHAAVPGESKDKAPAREDGE